jgi:hypothetical protein
MFVRRLDPQTEEVSSIPLNEATLFNLQNQVQNQQLPPSRVVLPYYQVVASEDQRRQWKEQTSYILSSNILTKRGVQHGDKIVPGSYHDEEQEMDNLPSTDKSGEKVVDGKSLHYPSIPVVDVTMSSSYLKRHAGTKRYLAQLPPTERTQVFLESPNQTIATRMLQDVLAKYYDSNWQLLMGDLQLAYTLFLYLQCLSSLEHWYVRWVRT